jgi:hypothetical protein
MLRRRIASSAGPLVQDEDAAAGLEVAHGAAEPTTLRDGELDDADEVVADGQRIADLAADGGGGEGWRGEGGMAEGGIGAKYLLQVAVQVLVEGAQDHANPWADAPGRERDLDVELVVVDVSNDRAGASEASLAQ